MKWLKIVCLIIAVLLLMALSGVAGYGYCVYQLPKFQDVTIELGQTLPPIGDFLTQFADPEKAAMVTDAKSLDLSKTGTHSLTFIQYGREETVKLTVVDTTDPTASFRSRIASIEELPKAEDFVTESYDLSGTTVSFREPLAAPEGYGSTMVEIVVTDGNGNSITGQCTLSYVWLRDQFTMELGDTLEKSDLLLQPDKDAELLDQTLLDQINASPAGIYSIVSSSEGQINHCSVTVQDTTAPELVLKTVRVYKGTAVALEDFIESATDASGEVTLRLMSELSTKEFGSFPVIIEAEDVNGNITTAETTLEVQKDATPPYINGLSAITTDKHQTPDYTSGVSAYDDQDGYVEFTYDASRVDLTKAGTYYVTYKATDLSGNTATSRRKVTVNHDAEDTAALVKEIAAGLSSDAEAIRDYVRNTISYSTNWGGKDPVWYGFKERSGNCYVHALCLQELLEAKGYSTRLIWTTCKTHYWLIVQLNGTWKHIDATPGTRHSRYSLMDDTQRMETLSGRTWDKSNWPACE